MKSICINSADNVEVVLQTDGDIPFGHKIARRDIQNGENIIKYGFPIGHATQDIKKGEWVHSHNMVTNLKGTLSYSYEPEMQTQADSINNELLSFAKTCSFEGYLREDGRAGIRNEIWILPTVGCVADLAERLAQQMQKETDLTVRAFPHTFGCSQLGDDHANTRSLLAALAMHPNAGGVLLLGLGCENNQIADIKPLINSTRVRYLISQEACNEYEEGMTILRELSSMAKQDKRCNLPLSKLCIGLKCGGSDGLSGITANPLVGRLADLLIANGGSAILTEVPEMFGAETLLMNRCRDKSTFENTVRLINDFKDYYITHGEPVGENPSPGNKAGGITTLEEKSLGCVQKGGTSKVNDVLSYTQRCTKNGLSLLCAPGNDLVASTALAVSGCQIVLFTTGRGTPFGTCVPTLKISTNSSLAQKKPHWIDFDAGILLEHSTTDGVTKALLEHVINVANGRMTQNEVNNYSSISIWKNGVTL